MTATRSRTNSMRRRAIVVSVVLACIAAAALVRATSSPIERLVNVEADGPTPIYNIEIDDAAMREAATIIPDDDDARYFFQYPPELAQYEHDLFAVGRLYFSPALEVFRIEDARWVLAYRVPPRLPSGLREIRRHRIRPYATLLEVEPA